MVWLYKKPKHWENAKLCYMDADSFIVSWKTEDIYKDISEDTETSYDTWSFELGRPLSKEKIRK